MRLSKIFAVAAVAAIAVPASAASLLTSAAGYTGPVLNLSAFNSFYTFTAGPVGLPGGITYSSTNVNSVLGNGGYGLADNGASVTTLIVGTNSMTDTVTFTFATPVSQFGGGFNYAIAIGEPVGDSPVISAFDSSNNLIAAYDLQSLAPISTPGANDVFLFRGIDGGGTGIASFTLSGSFIIIAGTATGAVPEPANWALLIAGFGLVGAAMRRQRRTAAIA
jgi:PEP-CTERM motif